MVNKNLFKSFLAITKPSIKLKRNVTTNIKLNEVDTDIDILNTKYKCDNYTNVRKKILSYIGRNLHVVPHHPLSLVRQRIVDFFYKSFVNSHGNPLFSVYDNLSPIVTVEQNFDSLLVPVNHPSRAKTDCYYINKDYLLRAHTTAHDPELIRSGLDNFLVIGDVYRRDEIDRTHYPVFHQVDAVRLKSREELFPSDESLQLFESGCNTSNTGTQEKQTCHTLEAVKLMEHELKSTLESLSKSLFGNDIKFRWTESTFPFTQPSWELEVFYSNQWLELLGCGILKQPILQKAGVNSKIGWAFGLGLERLAMCLYQIPDIRLFWSQDSGFLNQFKINDPNTSVTYNPISQFPQCINDLSFWLPDQNEEFSSNDFYDLVRNIGGDIVEQVTLIDEFVHPKTKKISHCYRIIYRHMEKTLTQREANKIHAAIATTATKLFGVKIR